jgi:hypothetical protein
VYSSHDSKVKNMPKQFPAYVFIKEGCDAPATELDDTRENQMLRILIGIEQQAGLQTALIACETEFLNKDLPALKQLSAVELENFIKKINKHLAHGLVALNAAGFEAGNYCANTAIIAKETGIPEESYHSNQYLLMNNTGIINRKFGSAAAKNYSEFVIKFNEAFNNASHQGSQLSTVAQKYQFVKNSSMIDHIIKNAKLDQHPGYQYLCKAVRIIPTIALAKDMRENCQTIIALIKGDASPLHIAAQALKIAYIHPFYDCNGRTARVLCNNFLIAYGIKAVDFNNEDNKNKFYNAIENLETDPDALYNYLKQVTQSENSIVNQFHHMAFEGVDFREPYISNLTPGKVHRFANRYEVRDQSDKVIHLFDARYCFEKAKKYFNQSDAISVSLYYCMRAGDFFAADKKNEEAAQAYFAAAQLCFALNNYDSAYGYAKKAQDLLPIKQQVVTDFLNKLNFVDAVATKSAPQTTSVDNVLLARYKAQNINQAFRAAAANGQLMDMIVLINQGADINSQGTTSQQTALHMAYERFEKQGVQEVINFLLKLNACDQNIKDKDGKLAQEYKPVVNPATQKTNNTIK